MIYDCFSYFNEDLLLELRLNYLDEIVDKFIIIEANKTHAGNPKPKNFDIKNFEKFADKIIYVFLENLPETDRPWVLENYQRNYIHEVLKQEDPSPNDIIIVSDIDEIPPVEAIEEYKENPHNIGCFPLKHYNYYLNLLNETEPIWYRAKIFQYKEFYAPVKLSQLDKRNTCLPLDYNRSNTATRIRLKNVDYQLTPGGWHFSWLGGAEKIKLKLESFAHQEWNKAKTSNIEYIEDCLKNKKCLIEIDCHYTKVEIDKTFPKYLKDNLDKFKDFII